MPASLSIASISGHTLACISTYSLIFSGRSRAVHATRAIESASIAPRSRGVRRFDDGNPTERSHCHGLPDALLQVDVILCDLSCLGLIVRSDEHYRRAQVTQISPALDHNATTLQLGD